MFFLPVTGFLFSQNLHSKAHTPLIIEEYFTHQLNFTNEAQSLRTL